MIVRGLLLVALGWLLGFAGWAVTLPDADDGGRTDAIVVPTGAPGRIARGVVLLQSHRAHRMLISGVDRSVRAPELVATQGVPPDLLRCCVDLGRAAVDTRSNGAETARWLDRQHYRSVRLVTTDWHMRRADYELRRAVGADVRIVRDAVPSTPGLAVLVSEYNKYLLARGAGLVGW